MYFQMTNRSKHQFKSPLTMIIPYGLKSWMEGVCRAVVLEEPTQIPEFIAAYCEDLLKFRERDQSMDIKDVTHQYQDIREAKHITDMKGGMGLMYRQRAPEYQQDDPAPGHSKQHLSVNQKTSPRSIQKSNVTTWEPRVVSDYEDPSSVPRETDNGEEIEAVEELSTVLARCSEADITKSVYPGTAVECNEISVRGISPAVSAGLSASGITERAPSETAVSGAALSSLEYQSEASTASACVGGTSHAFTNYCLYKRVSSKTLLRTLAPERQTTSKPSSQTSFESDLCDELPMASDMSTRFCRARIPSGCLSDVMAQAVSARCYDSDSQGSVTRVMDKSTRETPSAPLMDELLASPSVSGGRISPAISSKSSRGCLEERAPSETVIYTYSGSGLSGGAFSETEVVNAARRTSSFSPGEASSMKVISNVEEAYKASAEEVSESPTAAAVGGFSPLVSTGGLSSNLSGCASHKTVLELSIHSVCSVCIPVREESLTRAPSVSIGDVAAELSETHKASSVAGLPESTSAGVGEKLAGVPARCSSSDVPQMALSECTVVGTTVTTTSPRLSDSVLSGRAFSDPELVNAACILSSVRIPRIEESERRKTGTPESHTPPRVPPKTFLVSAHTHESAKAPDMSPSLSLVRIPIGCLTDDVTTAASESISDSDSLEKTFSETRVVETSTSRTHSASLLDELLVQETPRVGRGSSTASSCSSCRSFGERAPSKTVIRSAGSDSSGRAFSDTDLVYEAHEIPTIRIVSSAKIASGQESMRRKAHTFSRVSPESSFSSAIGLSSRSSLATVPSLCLSDDAKKTGTIDNQTQSTEGLLSSPLHSHWAKSPTSSESDSLGLLERHQSEPELFDTAGQVSSVRILSREERVWRTAESPRVSPELPQYLVPRVSPQTSLVTIPSDPFMMQQAVSPTTTIGKISPGVSRSSLSETVVEGAEPLSGFSGIAIYGTERVNAAHKIPIIRIVSSDKIPRREESVGRTAETSRLSAQVSQDLLSSFSPNTSLVRIPSPPFIKRQLVSSTMSVGGMPSVDSRRSSRSTLPERAFSETAVEGVRYSERRLSGRALSHAAVHHPSHRVSTAMTSSSEESVGGTTETPGRQPSPRVSPRMSPSVSQQSNLDMMNPSVAVMESLRVTAAGKISDVSRSSRVSPIISPPNTYASARVGESLSVRIPSTGKHVGKTAETQTSFTSVLEKAIQVSEGSIRLCEEVISRYPVIHQRTVGVSLGASPGASPAKMFGSQNQQIQNTQSQSVQTNLDDHGPTPQSFPIRAEPSTPDQPGVLNSTNQVWTLYHLANEADEGTLSAEVIAQRPFNGSAHIRHFGLGHVLLAEGLPSPQQPDAHSNGGQPRQHHQPQPPPYPVSPQRAFIPRVRSATLPHPPPPQHPTISNQEISIPNYFLFHDGQRVSLGRSSPSVPTAMPTRSTVVRMDDTQGCLSFTVPMEMVSGGSHQTRSSRFLQVVGEDGNTVYSPSLIRIDTSKHAEETDQ
ncbi:hypothetical protein DPEC_G00065250 [Dallia pectoralis]|uniref:Uncharacterized protein n=1 Tax=Dallia pectoralis TaxID=75939 RepID=A0ACC2H8A4_DALPE|nr:hypothetical protein DPEC_G00065250 [Dallia pectoralis]